VTYEELLASVCENIRRARWAAGMTQEEVAARGFALKHYQEIEAGARQVTLKSLARLSDIFGVPVAALVETEGRAALATRVPLAAQAVTPPKRGRKPNATGRITSS
jgi:transcriptional regulator with XRE-family HTH domain